MSIKTELVHLTEDAFQAASGAHARMRDEVERYNAGDSVYKNDQRVGPVKTLAAKVLYNKVGEIVDKLHPRLNEGSPRAYFLPDSHLEGEELEIQQGWVDLLQAWYEMNEEADAEGDKQQITTKHVLMMGNAIRKVGWHLTQNRLMAVPVNPRSFAVDPQACDVSLTDAEYVVHRSWQTTRYVKRHYSFRRKNKDDTRHKIDELWIRPELAQDIGINAESMIKAVLIDDRVVDVSPSPWLYPNFPFACWRNFTEVDSDSLTPNEFFGYGYPSKIWTMQKLLDTLLADLILIIRNEAVGRVLAPKGMLDVNLIEPIHGLVIEYDDERYNINQLQELPPNAVPPILGEMIQYLDQKMEELTGVTAVFSGEAPQGELSGRAIAALQAASFTHISNLLRGMIAFKTRLARIKMSILQQMADVPLTVNQWRGGIDIREPFPEEARHIGYTIQVQDTSTLPQTPAGKIQLGQLLMQLGAIDIQKFLELTGIDKAYGIPIESNGAGDVGALLGQIRPNEDVLQGRQ